MFEWLYQGEALWFSVPAVTGTLVSLACFARCFAVRAALLRREGGRRPAAPVVPLAVGAFLMGSGWSGLGAWVGGGWALPTSLAVSVVSGLAWAWLLAVLRPREPSLES